MSIEFKHIPVLRTPKRPCAIQSTPYCNSVIVFAVVALAALANAPPATAQLTDSDDSAFVDGVPHVDGVSVDGIVIKEEDVVLDELGNTRVDLLPGSKEPEPLPAELEKHLEELSAERQQMAEAVAADEGFSTTTDFEDPNAPPRMDSGDPNPDRLNVVVSEPTADVPSGDPQ